MTIVAPVKLRVFREVEWHGIATDVCEIDMVGEADIDELFLVLTEHFPKLRNNGANMEWEDE